MLPDVAVHGTWVRSNVHDAFGRLCYRVSNRIEPGSIEFLVLWNADADLGTKAPSAGYHEASELEVRPYKPKPWFKVWDGKILEVIYEPMEDDNRDARSTVRPEGDLEFGEGARAVRAGSWSPRNLYPSVE